jgi:hypothetical protein
MITEVSSTTLLLHKSLFHFTEKAYNKNFKWQIRKPACCYKVTQHALIGHLFKIVRHSTYQFKTGTLTH